MREQQPICLRSTRWFVGLVVYFLVSSPFASVSTVSTHATGAEIQKALDQLPEEGGEVVLAPGRYEIRQPILLNRDRQTLRGSGAATVLWLAAGANCPVIILGSTEANPDKRATGLRLTDLVIDGNRAQQSVEAWQSPLNTSYIQNNGVMVQAVADSVVERVVVCAAVPAASSRRTACAISPSAISRRSTTSSTALPATGPRKASSPG